MDNVANKEQFQQDQTKSYFVMDIQPIEHSADLKIDLTYLIMSVIL